MTTNAELAILSLIIEQPRHGYQIEQVIEERGMRDWTEIGFSSIYYLLKKLEKGGLVEGQTGQKSGRGPARKVYHITAKGEAAWHMASLEALSIPRRVYPPFQLGLANLPALPPDEVLAALRSYQASLEERLAQIQATAEAQRPLPDYIEAMFSHSLTLIEAEWQWIKDFIKDLETDHD